MENELTKVMTNEQLQAMLAQYPDNASVKALIEGILATRKAEVEALAVKANFVMAIESLLTYRIVKVGKVETPIGLPKPPDDVHNLYLAWREVEVPTGEATEVEVVKPDGSKVKEMRTPTTKVWKWIAEVNKGFTVGKATSTSTATTTSKRAITVNKREGQSLKFVGNFTSASKACEHLKLTIGGDSATRVLTREGYILDAYTGTDFTAS